MKRLSPLLVAATLFAVLASGLIPSTPIQSLLGQEATQTPAKKEAPLAETIIGTWKLAEASTPGSPSGVATRLKLFTGTHWCVIQPDPDTGVIVFQHGGRYEIQGDKMKVTRDFAGESTKDMIGGTGTFTIIVDADTMKQADSDGVFNETWKRVK